MTQSLKGGFGTDVAIGIASSDPRAAAAADRMQKLGVRAATVKADQTDPAQVDKRERKVAARFGHSGASCITGTVLNVDGGYTA